MRPCILCFSPDGMEVRADRRGRPYCTCAACGSKVFLRGARSFRGVIYFGDYLSRVDATELARQVDASGKVLVPVAPTAVRPAVPATLPAQHPAQGGSTSG